MSGSLLVSTDSAQSAGCRSCTSPLGSFQVASGTAVGATAGRGAAVVAAVAIAAVGIVVGATVGATGGATVAIGGVLVADGRGAAAGTVLVGTLATATVPVAPSACRRDRQNAPAVPTPPRTSVPAPMSTARRPRTRRMPGVGGAWSGLALGGRSAITIAGWRWTSGVRGGPGFVAVTVRSPSPGGGATIGAGAPSSSLASMRSIAAIAAPTAAIES